MKTAKVFQEQFQAEPGDARRASSLARMAAVACLMLLTACIGPHKPVSTEPSPAAPAATAAQQESARESSQQEKAASTPPLPLPVPLSDEASAATQASTPSEAPVVDVKPVYVVAQAESYHLRTP